jgi:hypothetical protein
MAWHLGFITDEGQQMSVTYSFYKPDEASFHWDTLDKSMCLKINDVRTHVPAADWSAFLDFIEAANAELIRKTQPPLPAPTDELALKIAAESEDIDLDALTTALRYVDSFRKDPPTAAQLARLNRSVAS